MRNEEHRPSQDNGLHTRLMPANLAWQTWEKVPSYTKITFFSAFIIGILIHAFMFTNKFPNHDDLLYMMTIDTEINNPISMMRWFLPFAFRISGTWSTPWLNGILSVGYLAAAASFVTAALEIRNPFHCMMISGIMVSFPTVASTLSYMMFADAFFLSLVLACFSVYITQKYKFGFLAGILAIALSSGIYQAYFTVATGLSLGVLIVKLLKDRLKTKEMILLGGRLLATLAFGLLLFLLIARKTTEGITIHSAYGFSVMGFPVSEIFKRLGRILVEIKNYYYLNKLNVHYPFLKTGFLLAAVASIILLVRVFLLKKVKTVWNVLLLIFLLTAFVFSSYMILLITTFSPHTLMIYSLALLPILATALLDLSMDLDKDVVLKNPDVEKQLWLQKGVGWLTSVCSLLVAAVIGISILSYTETSNKAYLMMNIVYEETYAYSIRLVSAIESSEGYTTDMPVVCVGRPLITNNEEVARIMSDEVKLTGVIPAFHLTYLGAHEYYPFQLFLKYYVGWDKVIHRTGSEVSDRYSAMQEVQYMATYPQKDSVEVVDGMVVVRFE